MSWVTSEMKSRMRATAPLRSFHHSPKQSVTHAHVSQLSAVEGKWAVNHKCWLCKVSTKWTDQCQKFTSMSPSDRLKAVKERIMVFLAPQNELVEIIMFLRAAA